MTFHPRRGLVAAALILIVSAPATAHDPGLSALAIRIAADCVVADLSLASTDAAAINDVGRFAVEALGVHIDGTELRGSIESIAIDAAQGVRATIKYDIRSGSRLAVSSAVPGRLARGHRELLSIRDRDGSLIVQRMLDESSTRTVVDVRRGGAGSASPVEFFKLGILHILGGFDHLLFLAALLLAVRTRREVIKVITAFTLAHSLTLAASVMELVQIPVTIVEPLIAASIVCVGLENLIRRNVSSRWKQTFGFGLIHGFGFASALRELGIGGGAAGVAVPLASFNVGVELGQIAIAMVMLPVLWSLRDRPMVRARLSPACSCLIVAAGAYWFVQRVFA